MSNPNPKIYAENPPDSVTIPLKHKIHFGDTVIDQLVVRPINGGDQMRLKHKGDLPLPMLTELAAMLTGQPEQVIAVVTGEDLANLNATVRVFFMSSQETGSEPSE